MENEVSKMHSPKRHDSSCVAVNIALWALLFILLLHWSPSVLISANQPLKTLKAWLFIVVCFNFPSVLRNHHNLPVLYLLSSTVPTGFIFYGLLVNKNDHRGLISFLSEGRFWCIQLAYLIFLIFWYTVNLQKCIFSLPLPLPNNSLGIYYVSMGILC